MLLGFTIFLLVLLFAGMPVGFSLCMAGLTGMFLFMDGTAVLTQLPMIAYKTLDDFVLTAVPLYILMSHILLIGKVGNDLFELGNKWLRHLPGGLGVATVFACAIFAAIAGSSVATAVTIGAMAIPEMIKRNYERSAVLGTVAAGGTLGILIPPSIPMILYGSITGESVGKLFVSGIVPGIMMTLFFVILVVFQSKHLPLQPAASWQERFSALRKSFWGLLLPIIVVGGIYSGAFTPTEAAAVGTLYSLFITFFIYRTITLRQMPEILTETVKTTAMIFAIMIGAMLFGFVLTVLQVPQQLTEFVAQMEASRWVVLLGINILLLILGCILETVSIILITLPILYPIIIQLGFDPIWFNVIMLINMELALITPPIGMNLFVIQGISPESKMEQIIRGSMPFAALMVLEMIILCVFPELVTWLPNVIK